MKSLAVLAIVATGVLTSTSCSRDEIDRSALTTTTSFAPTHSAAIEAEREALGVPDEDGGALCAAVDQWRRDTASSAANESLDALAAQLDLARRQFDASVLPTAPEPLQREAAAFSATVRAAADSIAENVGGGASLTELMTTGAVQPFVDYLALFDPMFADAGADTETYRDAFVAWIDDPCGPKPLSRSGG